MIAYSYKAREETGKLIVGEMEAGSKDELAAKLRKMGYTPTHIEKTGSKSTQISAAKEASFSFGRIKTMDMIMFNFQLANMIDAGIPLLSCLQTLSKQMKNAKLKSIVKKVSQSVTSGNSFSDSLMQFPKTFPNLFINMVRSGEASGRLKTVLTRYANYIESQEEIKQKIRNALFYPILLLVMGVAVMLVITTFIIPQFIEIFSKANVALPLPTFILFQMSVVIKKYWYLLILAIFLGIVGVGSTSKTKKGKFYFDRLKLKIPILGPLFYDILVARFCRTLATLLKSGVSVLNALDITRDIVGNVKISEVINKARISVEEGETIGAALKKAEEFPADVVQMIIVGEEAGKLDTMLDKVADFYDTSIGHSIKRLLTLIEPILIILMGALAGLIMAAMILPLFDMVKTI